LNVQIVWEGVGKPQGNTRCDRQHKGLIDLIFAHNTSLMLEVTTEDEDKTEKFSS